MVSKNQLASPRSAFRNFYHPHFSLQKILRPPPPNSSAPPPPPFFVIVLVCCCFISETQGQSVGSGERAGRKFSSTGERAPGYRLSPNYFKKFKRMPAPDWAQKMLCIIVPNRRTVSPQFFFVSSYTTAIVSITACVAHAPKKYMQSGNFQFDIWYPGALSPVLQNFRRALSPDPTDCPWVSEDGCCLR